MITKLTKSFLIGCIILITACAPRGENRSLDEVLLTAQEKFTAALQASDTPQNEKVRNLSAVLEKFLNTPDAADRKHLADEVALQIEGLTVKAGFPSRPAMTELALQYQNIAAGNATAYFSQGSAKLLVARTYIMLNSELSTTAFRL